MKKKRDDHNVNLLGEQRPGDPRLHAQLPGGYIGPYVVTFGDRLKLEEGGEITIDVENTKETAQVFGRLVVALINELALVRRSIESVSRPGRSGLRRPPKKRDAVIMALSQAQIQARPTSRLSFERQVHRIACQILRKLASADPEMYSFAASDLEPVTLRYVRSILIDPGAEIETQSESAIDPYPKIGITFRYEERRRIVLSDIPSSAKK